MRDWTKTLRPASFRGVAFFIDKEGVEKFGRAVAVHTYVKAEDHATEDMGRLPREFRLTAYLASDTADAQARALIAACSAPSPGSLVLPIYGPTQVRCTSGNQSHEKGKLGYIAFELEFVEAGEDGAGFPARPIGDRSAGGLMDAMPGLVADALMSLPFAGLPTGIGVDLPGLSIDVALPTPSAPIPSVGITLG